MYSMKEKELFNWLKNKFLPDLEPTDQFAYTDAYSKKHDLTIELKSRNTHYDELLIEKIKWDKLISHRNVRYINWTPKGIYSFDVQKISEPLWADRLMPQTTEFECNVKVLKVVGFLNISQAKDISTI